MESAFLIPNKGLMVRDPKTKSPLSQNGEVKSMLGFEGRYWRRRIRDGAVIIGNLAKPSKIRIRERQKGKKEE